MSETTPITGRMMLRNVRLSFPRIWDADRFDDSQEPRYQATAIFPVDQEQVIDQKLAGAFPGAFQVGTTMRTYDLVLRCIDHVIKAKWDGKVQRYRDGVDPGRALMPDKLCVQPGSKKARLDGYGDGIWYVTANRPATEGPVDIRNRQSTRLTKDALTRGAPQVPYSGCYVNMLIDLWAQDNKFGRRINAKLVGVQFLRDGAAFSGGPPSRDEDFDVLDEDTDSTEWDPGATVDADEDDLLG